MTIPVSAFFYFTWLAEWNKAISDWSASSRDQFPRRYRLDDPPLGNNYENWQKGHTEQAFTPGDRSVQVLSTQRLWFDKNSPAPGEGK